MDIKPLVKRVYGRDNLKSGPALLYLYRRFGFTPVGGDPDSEICRYAFTTHEKGVWLVLSVGAAYLAIQTAVTGDLADELTQANIRQDHKWRNGLTTWAIERGYIEPHEENKVPSGVRKRYMRKHPFPSLSDRRRDEEAVERFCAAVESALSVMLESVPVGNLSINILGVTKKASTASPSNTAGMGVFIDVYKDPQLWHDFMTWLQKKGDGDRLKAIREILPPPS